MNIFYLASNTKQCAEMHVDRHCVKMILEYNQILSTTHRVLDGKVVVGLSASGRKQTKYVLPDYRESILYSATHINHPSTVWTRQSEQNYQWLYNLFVDLIAEYNFRYEKTHACSKHIDILKNPPNNIPKNKLFTEPTPAMPDEYKVPGDSIQSYKNYYLGAKTKLFSWKKRNPPSFVLTTL